MSDTQNSEQKTSEQVPNQKTYLLDPKVVVMPSLQIDELERVAIYQALRKSYGSTSGAARSTGLSPRTIQNRLQTWNVPSTDFAPGGRYGVTVEQYKQETGDQELKKLPPMHMKVARNVPA